MATLTQTTAPIAFSQPTNWLTAYATFIQKAEFYRAAWAASAILIQGCILTPALLLTMFYGHGSDWQLLMGNLTFLLVLVPILSAQPLKYIVPAFAVSFVFHVAVVLGNLL